MSRKSDTIRSKQVETYTYRLNAMVKGLLKEDPVALVLVKDLERLVFERDLYRQALENILKVPVRQGLKQTKALAKKAMLGGRSR